MKYAEFQSWLADLVGKAPTTRRLVFARGAIGRLLNSLGEIDPASEYFRIELSEAACIALLSATREVLTASPEVLKGYLDIIDAGTLTEGDMDNYLLDVICGLQHWANYLDDQDTDSLLGLANIIVDQILWEASVPLDADFLASPEMRAERDRIAALLVA